MQKPSIKYGFLGGVTVLFYFMLLYASNSQNMLNPALIWASLLIYLFFMFKAAQEDCANEGINRDFREIIRTPFTTFLLINLIYWLFYYGLHLYDPGLILAEMQLEKDTLSTQLSNGVGDPQQANALRERIAELEKYMNAPQTQPLGPIITQMCIGALGGFALSAGIAAFFRAKSDAA